MGRTWCRTDPTVLVDGKPYGLAIGIDGDARGHIVSVTVALGFVEPVEVEGQGHKLLGVPVVFELNPEGFRGALLRIDADDGYLCTLSLAPRDGDGEAWFGGGLTPDFVEAAPVEDA